MMVYDVVAPTRLAPAPAGQLRPAGQPRPTRRPRPHRPKPPVRPARLVPAAALGWLLTGALGSAMPSTTGVGAALATTGVGTLLTTSALHAQVPQTWQRRWPGGGWRNAPLREGVPERRGGFTFCRLLYTSGRREAGGQGWSTDYPLSDRNSMIRLPQLTEADISEWLDGEPGHAVVRATDPGLCACPCLFASDVGTAGFDDFEVRRLREFLLKGGFLWADDFWGERAWEHWVAQIRRVLPEYPIVELTPEHPLFSSLYHVRRVPQIPSIQFWRRSGGLTSERGWESEVPRLHGILDDRGRLLVLMGHNTDIADGWEREGEDEEFFYLFSPEAYALGINIVIWAMSR